MLSFGQKSSWYILTLFLANKFFSLYLSASFKGYLLFKSHYMPQYSFAKYFFFLFILLLQTSLKFEIEFCEAVKNKKFKFKWACKLVVYEISLFRILKNSNWSGRFLDNITYSICYACRWEYIIWQTSNMDLILNFYINFE